MIMIIETLRYKRYRRHYFICLTFMIYFIALGAVTWIAGKYILLPKKNA